VPILRAGLGMLEGMVRLLPSAEVGFLGMIRNEETLEAITTYANRLPDDLTGRQCYVLDPMLATGGHARRRDPLSGRSGGRRHHRDHPALRAGGHRAPGAGAQADLQIPVTLVTGAVDERLNDKGYIVPGLGDAGRPALRRGLTAWVTCMG
jgi:uracil phosphoribosyltransferase